MILVCDFLAVLIVGGLVEDFRPGYSSGCWFWGLLISGLCVIGLRVCWMV